MEIAEPLERASQLVVELFLAIKLLAGYPLPSELPAIHRLPQGELRAAICKGRCGDVNGYYMPGGGVYVDAALDVEHDVAARSVLLHELVHHVQALSAKFDRVASQCDRWYLREAEAYDIQNAYLRLNGERRRYLFDAIPGMCKEPAPPAAPE